MEGLCKFEFEEQLLFIFAGNFYKQMNALQ